MIKNVIFDNDGVLICSNDVYYHFYHKIGAEYGLNVTKKYLVQLQVEDLRTLLVCLWKK